MIRSSTWERLYEDALLELDPVKLGDKVTIAESAVHKRIDELKNKNVAAAERQGLAEHHKLQDALFSLQCLRRLLPPKQAPVARQR